MELFVVVGVHEMVRVAILVHVLHLALVQNRAFHEVFRAQLLIGERAAADVPELDPHEAAKVAGGHMVKLEHAKQVIA